MKDFTIAMPFPPSVNAMWRSFHGRTILSKRGREYRKFALAILENTNASEARITERVSVRITLQPPTERKYDIDNFIKALFDALTHAHFWEDDEQVYHMEVFKGRKITGGLVTLHITEYTENKDE